jgi:hypothetical protein
MKAEDIVAMFTFAQDRPLQVTLRDPSGWAWAQNAPCEPPYVSGQFPQPEDGPPVVRIKPLGEDGYYTDFPVEKAGPDDQGNLVLTGSKGTATFQVGAQ